MVFTSAFFISSCSQYSDEFNKNDYLKISVKSVYDGDTFTDENKNRYRLIGINAAEIPNENTTSKLQEKFAYLARDFLSEKILNKSLSCKYWKLDRYKRRLIIPFYQNVDLSILLLKKGLVRMQYISNTPGDFYFYDSKYYQKLLEAQNSARESDKGIWAYTKEQREQIFAKNIK